MFWGRVIRFKLRMGLFGRIVVGLFFFWFLLLISAGVSTFSLLGLVREVRGVLDDNYASIQYCRVMLESLEDQRLSLLHAMHYRYGKADSVDLVVEHADFDSAGVHFERNLALARENATLDGEKEYVDSLRVGYEIYSSTARLFFSDMRTSRSSLLQRYVEEVTPEHIRLVGMVNDLLELNHRGLYGTRLIVEATPERALRPGLIIAGVGLVYLVMLIFLIYRFYVRPLRAMTRSVDQFTRYRRYPPVTVLANDELKELKESIDRLVLQSRSHDVQRDE